VTPYCRPIHRAWAAVLVTAVLVSSAGAASPREALLRLVPDDVAFCLVIQDLRGHGAAMRDSPFSRRFRTSPLGMSLTATDDFKKLLNVDKFLQEHLGIDSNKLANEILGDALVFAYRPGPPGKPEAEEGLLLIRAREAKTLADLVDRVNEVQKKAGDLTELEALVHKGHTYYRRVEKNQTRYYWLEGPVLAVSEQQGLLRQAIDLATEPPRAEREPAVARQMRRLGVDQALVGLWVNPRSFDADMERKADAAKPEEAVPTRAFLATWKALDGIALSIDLQMELEVTLAVGAKAEALPAAFRRLSAEASKRSELWDRFPPDAIVAVAGRVDVAALAETVGTFLTPDLRQTVRAKLGGTLSPAVGRDFFKEIVPNLGPDGGLCVWSPPAGGQDWFPQAVACFRVRPGAGAPGVDQAVLGGVNFFAQLAVVAYNQQAAQAMALKTVTSDKAEIKYLSGNPQFPAGLQPAYALVDGYLVLGTSPEAIRRFQAMPTASAGDADAVPLLRVSATEAARYLQQWRAPLIAFLAEKNQISKQEAATRLSGLVAGLQWVDRVELLQKVSDGQVRLTARVKTTQPLK
jgi:hypothetical protein